MATEPRSQTYPRDVAETSPGFHHGPLAVNRERFGRKRAAAEERDGGRVLRRRDIADRLKAKFLANLRLTLLAPCLVNGYTVRPAHSCGDETYVAFAPPIDDVSVVVIKR